MLHIQMPEQQDPGRSRRDFLRLAVAAPVGAVAGTALYGGIEAGATVTEEHTALRADSDALDQYQVTAACGEPPSAACAEGAVHAQAHPANNAVKAIANEGLWRAVPSFVLDLFDRAKGRKVDPSSNVLFGDGAKRVFDRREALVGLGVAAYSTAVNRALTKVWDTGVVPLEGVAGSMGLWWLQRCSGFLSNTSANFTYNTLRTTILSKRYGR